MSSLVKATKVSFDDDSMWVELSDGRTLGVPLAWFPRLLRASRAERKAVSISGRGLHWDALDEDIPRGGLPGGQGEQPGPPVPAAAE